LGLGKSRRLPKILSATTLGHLSLGREHMGPGAH
jgi:hypothetical protein